VPHPDPKVKKERIILSGDVPSPLILPQGCVFHTRCPDAHDKCKTQIPTLQELRSGHKVACHLY
ncbi:oligopeptide/dipeptide ABC transporter ATP-binding protein, partial [Acinetobacter baumannii]